MHSTRCSKNQSPTPFCIIISQMNPTSGVNFSSNKPLVSGNSHHGEVIRRCRLVLTVRYLPERNWWKLKIPSNTDFLIWYDDGLPTLGYHLKLKPYEICIFWGISKSKALEKGNEGAHAQYRHRYLPVVSSDDTSSSTGRLFLMILIMYTDSHLFCFSFQDLSKLILTDTSHKYCGVWLLWHPLQS